MSLDGKSSVALPLCCPQGCDRRDFLSKVFYKQFSKGEPIVAGFKSCGTKVEYSSVDEIPIETTMCPCGDDQHYLVLWIEAPIQQS